MAPRSDGLRRPQTYPEELRERAVPMIPGTCGDRGESHGVIARMARVLRVGAESLRGWVNRADRSEVWRPGPAMADADADADAERIAKVRVMARRADSPRPGPRGQ